MIAKLLESLSVLAAPRDQDTGAGVFFEHRRQRQQEVVLPLGGVQARQAGDDRVFRVAPGGGIVAVPFPGVLPASVRPAVAVPACGRAPVAVAAEARQVGAFVDDLDEARIRLRRPGEECCARRLRDDV